MFPLSASPPEECLAARKPLWSCFATHCEPLLYIVELSAYSQGCPWQLNRKTISTSHSFERGILFLRKEVIQPHLPIRLPCYDFTPVIRPAFGGSFLAVRSPTSGISDSHGVTGGVYKTRERIHRSILICDY